MTTPPEFLPPDLDPPTPEEEAEALDDLSLQDDDDLVLARAPQPPFGRSWAYDFTRPGFMRPDAAHAPLETRGKETIYFWCIKALQTARGAHPVYPSDYGMDEPFGEIGRVFERTGSAGLETRVHDALTFHPRIVDVQDFSAFQDPNDDVILMSFTVVTDDDDALTVQGLPVVSS